MHTTLKPYLCGPINGCSDSECNDWRAEVKRHFPNAIDPMRRDYRGREEDSYKEIVEGDKQDIKECHCFIANCPKPSVGASMEILLAWQAHLLVVTIVPDIPTASPWLKYHSDILVTSVSAAIKYVKAHMPRICPVCNYVRVSDQFVTPPRNICKTCFLNFEEPWDKAPRCEIICFMKTFIIIFEAKKGDAL